MPLQYGSLLIFLIPFCLFLDGQDGANVYVELNRIKIEGNIDKDFFTICFIRNSLYYFLHFIREVNIHVLLYHRF